MNEALELTLALGYLALSVASYVVVADILRVTLVRTDNPWLAGVALTIGAVALPVLALWCWRWRERGVAARFLALYALAVLWEGSPCCACCLR